MAKQTSSAEVDRRISIVAKLLAEGYSSGEVVQIAAKEWGVKSRQAAEYTARARVLLRADWDADREQFLQDLLTHYRTLYRKALKAEQYAAACGALNSMARLAGAGG